MTNSLTSPNPLNASSSPPIAIRGSFLDFVADPFYQPLSESVRYIFDGLLVIENGLIQDFGHYEQIHHRYSHLPTVAYPEKLIMPGFVDLHVHYPQLEVTASYGEQLLEWLNKYTFVTEVKFADRKYAQRIASLFCDELLRHGTTTALVFATVHPESVEALFEECDRRHLRMISGKVLMDRHAPEGLMDTAESSYRDSKRLIEKWHGRGRLSYAVTPRFAVTSTPEQLHFAGELLQEFPDVYLHTHLSENVQEVDLVAQLYPNSAGYLDVYDQAGLVGSRSIFAHGVQLTEAEFKRLSQAQSTIAFCPTSNLFLGSGLFKLHEAKSHEHPIKVGLGTDIGAGTSLSLLHTAGEAYKVAQLQGQSLSAFRSLFLATLGGAKALSLDDKIGSFDVGKEADFIVLNPQATPLLSLRNQPLLEAFHSVDAIADIAFSLMVLGDDRAIEATYVLGEIAHLNH